MRRSFGFGAVPALLAAYSIARHIDGGDGEYGNGWAWDVGHVAFLGAFLGFGLLTAYFWQRTPRRHAGVVTATGAALVGVALFCWVIVTDLVPWLDERAALPDLLMTVGPVLFTLGFSGSLAFHGAQHRLPLWGLPPALTFVAFPLVGADLDLLPVMTVLVAVALLWVGVRSPRRTASPGTVSSTGARPAAR